MCYIIPVYLIPDIYGNTGDCLFYIKAACTTKLSDLEHTEVCSNKVMNITSPIINKFRFMQKSMTATLKRPT